MKNGMTGQKLPKEWHVWTFGPQNTNDVGYSWTTNWKNICSLKMVFHENLIALKEFSIISEDFSVWLSYFFYIWDHFNISWGPDMLSCWKKSVTECTARLWRACAPQAWNFKDGSGFSLCNGLEIGQMACSFVHFSLFKGQIMFLMHYKRKCIFLHIFVRPNQPCANLAFLFGQVAIRALK